MNKTLLSQGFTHIYLFAVFLLTLLLPILADGKAAQADGEKEKKILLEIDAQLAQKASQTGILQALSEVITEETALLPSMGHPVIGLKAFEQWLKQTEGKNTALKMKWLPIKAEVSAAGDLGYTHGKYQLPTPENKNDTPVIMHYGNIWKKQADGKWKLLGCVGLIPLRNLETPKMVSGIIRDKLDKKTAEVVDTEYAFSAFTGKNGIAEGFHRFIDDNGRALAGAAPPRTKASYAATIKAQKENKNSSANPLLEWEPYFSFVSASADLALQYGPFVYTAPTPEGKKRKSYGYFMSVWKKQKEGNWKFVFDGGNYCPPPQAKERNEKKEKKERKERSERKEH